MEDSDPFETEQQPTSKGEPDPTANIEREGEVENGLTTAPPNVDQLEDGPVPAGVPEPQDSSIPGSSSVPGKTTDSSPITNLYKSLTKREKGLGLVILFLALWNGWMFAAPLALPADTVDFGTEGIVSRNDFHEEREDMGMSGWVSAIYWFGDINCHQKHERSLFINGNQMPFCSRDISIFMGLMVGVMIFWRRSYPMPFWFIIAGLVPIAMDGGSQLFNFYESTNWLRIMTGGLAGITMGLVIAHMATDLEYSRALRRAWEAGRPFIPPPPEMPHHYRQTYLGGVALVAIITGLRVVYHAF